MEGGWIEGGENGSGEFGSVRLRRIGIKVTWIATHVIHLNLVSFYPPKTVKFNTYFRTTMQFNTLELKVCMEDTCFRDAGCCLIEIQAIGCSFMHDMKCRVVVPG